MSEAEMIGIVLIALASIVSLFLTVGKPLMDNQKVMIELTITMKNLSQKLTELESNNHDAHRRLWAKNEELAHTLEDHELRLHDLEKKEE